MIFVTVGTELPFDRLVSIVDGWAAETGRSDVFAQIGRTDWRPKFILYEHFLDPPEFTRRLSASTIIISHAGMGSILSALQASKPILVMPRRAALGEHRNEHQLATAYRMKEMARIGVSFDEADLRDQLARIDELQAGHRIAPFADPNLTTAIHNFILEPSLLR